MKRLSPKALIIFFFRDTPGLVIFLPLIAFAIFQAAGGLSGAAAGPYLGQINLLLETLIWIILPLLLLFFLVWVFLTFNSYRYELTEREFRKEYGVIRKKYVSIPYEQVQNVDIYRDVAERLLGLSELHIQTAGMSEGAKQTSAEGILPGLAKDEAENLRSELIKRASLSQ